MRWLAIVVLVACGKSAAPAPDAMTALCTDSAPLAPTFANMQKVFASICTECHIAGVELDLAPSVSYANLVGVTAPSYANPPTDESCGGVLVVPGNPTASYLYLKLTTPPCAGSQMPLTELGMSFSLPACELTLVHDWIAAGAPND